MFQTYQQPSIEIFNIRIDEPVVALTDLVVGVVCYYAFFKLNKIPLRNRVHLYLKLFFLSMGIATTVGGIIGHAFIYKFTFAWKLPGWWTSMAAVALIERAVIEFSRSLITRKLGDFFAWLNVIELTTFMVLTFTTLNFFFVEVHTAYGFLVVVASFSSYIFYRTKNAGSRQFLNAVCVSGISAIFYLNQWGISPWFNHTDISHIMLAISATFFYRGARIIIYDPLAESNNGKKIKLTLKFLFLNK